MLVWPAITLICLRSCLTEQGARIIVDISNLLGRVGFVESTDLY